MAKIAISIDFTKSLFWQSDFSFKFHTVLIVSQGTIEETQKICIKTAFYCPGRCRQKIGQVRKEVVILCLMHYAKIPPFSVHSITNVWIKVGILKVYTVRFNSDQNMFSPIEKITSKAISTFFLYHHVTQLLFPEKCIIAVRYMYVLLLC